MIKEFKINDILEAMENILKIEKKDRKIVKKKNNKQKRGCFGCQQSSKIN